MRHRLRRGRVSRDDRLHGLRLHREHAGQRIHPPRTAIHMGETPDGHHSGPRGHVDRGAERDARRPHILVGGNDDRAPDAHQRRRKGIASTTRLPYVKVC